MSATLTATVPAASSVPELLLTAEEFCNRYGDTNRELVRGRVGEQEMPNTRHGFVCASIGRFLGNHVDAAELGRVASNDSFILVAENPDTVRGPDVSYYSFNVLPPGPVPEGLTRCIPELVFEVRSPSNSWKLLFQKMGEYLNAGVKIVVLVDPDSATASVYRPDELQQIFDNDDDFELSDLLPGFKVPVKKFFV